MQLLPASVVLIISLGTVCISAREDDDDEEEEDEAEEEEAEAGERLDKWASFLAGIADWTPPLTADEHDPELELEPEAAGFSGNLMVSLGTTLPTRLSFAARMVSFGTMCGVFRSCWPRVLATSSSAHDEEQEEASASKASCGLATRPPSPPPPPPLQGRWMRRGSTRLSSPGG